MVHRKPTDLNRRNINQSKHKSGGYSKIYKPKPAKSKTKQRKTKQTYYARVIQSGMAEGGKWENGVQRRENMPESQTSKWEMRQIDATSKTQNQNFSMMP